MKDTTLLKGLSHEKEPESDEAAKVSDDLAKDFNQKKIERLNEEIEDLKQDRQQRKVFSSRIFIFMCAYMSVSLIIVIMDGFGWIKLEPSVIITLLTTTLANVIGVFNFVAKYLFHNK